jgi:chromatin remodeling complex protein RSC6
MVNTRGCTGASCGAEETHKSSFLPLEGAKITRQIIIAFARGRATSRTRMAKKSARKPNTAFMKPVQPDAVLAAVVGAKPLPRTELTKKLWDYIKKNNLQDKKAKTQINADDKLKPVFGGKKSVSMFEMTKLVSAHLVK